MTRRLILKEVHRSHPIALVSPEDFTYEAGGEISPGEVLNDPRFTLYCFDPENRCALFVESDDPEAVDRSPFYYQGQAGHAVGLVSMPFEVFHAVAGQIPSPAKGVIFVHSVGRCGSTLLSKVLAAVPSIHSLSEPDDLTQLARIWAGDPTAEEWIGPLLTSSVKWRCKPRGEPLVEHVAIKPRSEVMAFADFLGESFPDAKHFFLYRNGLAWVRTIFRGFPEDRDPYDADRNREMGRSWSRTLPLIQELWNDEAPMNPIQIRALGWISAMESYLKLAEYPIPICAARYEELVADPKSILSQFFAFCEIEDVDWDAIQTVLDQDSQAGTIYDREERRKLSWELTDALVQDVFDLVASRPKLDSPDVRVPGTLTISPG